MTRQLPTDDAVKAAMDAVLADASATGRRATVSAVERHLDLHHATFYRHYQHLITEHFQPRLAALRRPDRPAASPSAEHAQEATRRLRLENTELRRTVELYAEAIRPLTRENEALRHPANVVILPSRANAPDRHL